MSDLRTQALYAARVAATQLAEAFATGEVVATTKTNRHDLVTAWDQHIEGLVTQHLARDGAVFWGEETGRATAPPPGSIEWIIDPIDGTSNFVHGYPVFSISIAAAIDDEVVAGVVVDPVTGAEFSADASGAYLNDAPLTARPTPPHDTQYNLVTSFPAAEILHRAPEASQLFGQLVTHYSTVRRLVSGALEICYAARGIADVVLGVDTKPWDVAAASYILRQAGGRYHTGVAGPSHLAPHYVAFAPGRESQLVMEVFRQLQHM